MLGVLHLLHPPKKAHLFILQFMPVHVNPPLYMCDYSSICYTRTIHDGCAVHVYERSNYAEINLYSKTVNERMGNKTKIIIIYCWWIICSLVFVAGLLWLKNNKKKIAAMYRTALCVSYYAFIVVFFLLLLLLYYNLFVCRFFDINSYEGFSRWETDRSIINYKATTKTTATKSSVYSNDTTVNTDSCRW